MTGGLKKDLLTGLAGEFIVALDLLQQTTQLLVKFFQEWVRKAFFIDTDHQAGGFCF